jgi:hypothetical protein
LAVICIERDGGRWRLPRGALYAGACRVFAVTIAPVQAIDPRQPELIFRLAYDFHLAGRLVLVLDPGMDGAMERTRILGHVSALTSPAASSEKYLVSH